jgi:hypothetical protein
MEHPEQPRNWVGEIDFWMIVAAIALAILMIVVATQGQA